MRRKLNKNKQMNNNIVYTIQIYKDYIEPITDISNDTNSDTCNYTNCGDSCGDTNRTNQYNILGYNSKWSNPTLSNKSILSNPTLSNQSTLKRYFESISTEDCSSKSNCSNEDNCCNNKHSKSFDDIYTEEDALNNDLKVSQDVVESLETKLEAQKQHFDIPVVISRFLAKDFLEKVAKDNNLDVQDVMIWYDRRSGVLEVIERKHPPVVIGVVEVNDL